MIRTSRDELPSSSRALRLSAAVAPVVAVAGALPAVRARYDRPGHGGDRLVRLSMKRPAKAQKGDCYVDQQDKCWVFDGDSWLFVFGAPCRCRGPAPVSVPRPGYRRGAQPDEAERPRRLSADPAPDLGHGMVPPERPAP